MHNKYIRKKYYSVTINTLFGINTSESIFQNFLMTFSTVKFSISTHFRRFSKVNLINFLTNFGLQSHSWLHFFDNLNYFSMIVHWNIAILKNFEKFEFHTEFSEDIAPLLSTRYILWISMLRSTFLNFFAVFRQLF